ncbi:SET domain-containing protein-lysine N-methyltransferase [Paraburkholderia metrosideri]|uniref:SET domain-containing protein-lysine N-methyltransferase n=1 Tax=Paraburkholderia metrosideri TaxID=580937 RepID=A0ABW9DTD3_9BURK
MSDALTMRDKVYAIEKEVQKLPQVECPVRHYFAPGIYAREMTIPAGVLITGAVHRHEHLCTVSKGRLIVSMDKGMKEVSAPCTLISKAGAKRVGYAVEETVWTTYHATTETDLDKLMIEITESTNEELLGGVQNVQRLAEEARADYQRFLVEYGLSQELVTRLVENQGDQVPMPEQFDAIERRASPIAGEGMFATRDIDADEFIAPARIGNFRTPAGRFINHSCYSNVVFMQDGNGGLSVVALRPIRKDEEITIDYRQAASVNGTGMKPIGREA